MSSTLSKPYQAQQSKSLDILSLHLLNMLPRCPSASNDINGTKRGLTAKESIRSRSAQRRVSRACDECYHRRVKCDGRKPCEHCTEFRLVCEYNREQKKRGKASRKDLVRQTAVAAAATATATATGTEQPFQNKPPFDGRQSLESQLEIECSANLSQLNLYGTRPQSQIVESAAVLGQTFDSGGETQPTHNHWSNAGSPTELMYQYQPLLTGRQADAMSNGCEFNCHVLNGWQPLNNGTFGDLSEYEDLPYSPQNSLDYPIITQPPAAFKLEDGPLPGFSMDSTGHAL